MPENTTTVDLTLFRDVTTSTDPDDNTEVQYMYRDASNYKQRGTAVFAGPPTPDLVQRLIAALPRNHSDIADFVAAQVGLPNLQEEMPGEYDDDDGWHELTGIAATKMRPDEDRTFEDFVAECERVEEWDDNPRVAYDDVIRAAIGYGEGLATHWMEGRGATWYATTIDVSEFAAKQGLDSERVDVRGIRSFPPVGQLRYSRTNYRSQIPTAVEVPTPGTVEITAEQLREVTGQALTPGQLTRLTHLLLARTDDLITLVTAAVEGED